MKQNTMKNMVKKKPKNSKEPIKYVFDDTGYTHLLFEFYHPTYDFKLEYTFVPEYEYED